jgi:rhodanese-related sulfurtransferase
MNISKILSITLISVLLSLAYNHFNPKGLKIIREERVLNWDDVTPSESDTLITPIDKINTTALKSSDTLPIDKNDESTKSFQEPKAIKLDFAYKLFKDGVKFIDARSTDEFSEGHIKGAVNIPFYGSENYLDVINSLNKNEMIVTYCSGADCDISILSADELFEMGFKRVYIFIGGFEEWTKNNYPISKN